MKVLDFIEPKENFGSIRNEMNKERKQFELQKHEK